MKKGFLLGALSLSVFFASAQTQSFTYQGIVTNNNNVPYNNRTVAFRISILQSSTTGTAEYVEEHAGIITSANGVFGVNIGNGKAKTGTFAGIKWTATTKYLKVEVDTLNGTNYIAIGTPSLLQSVPFALQATNAVNATNATNATNAVNSTNATTATNALKIQNVSVSTTVPTDGQMLYYNGTTKEWTTADFFWNPIKNIFGAGVYPGSYCQIRNDSPRLVLTKTNNSYITQLGKNSDEAGFLGLYKGDGTTTAHSFFQQEGSYIRNDLYVGSDYPAKVALRAYSSLNSDPAVYIHNNNNTNPQGLQIRLGTTSVNDATRDYIEFRKGDNVVVGSIQGSTTSSVAYTTSSDARLKTNVSKIGNSLTKVMAMKPVYYEWKADLGKKDIGFLAQELQTVYPWAVSGDSTIPVEKEHMMVDYSKLTPVLTAAIQEQQALIEKLQKENALLKADNSVIKAELKISNEAVQAQIAELKAMIGSSSIKK